MQKFFKYIINLSLILVIIYSLLPFAERGKNSYDNMKTYQQAHEEKEELKITRYIDWIRVEGTKIDYPVVWKEGNNSYYLSHDIYGNENSHGAIFYDGGRVPYSDHVTVLYGHCMRDKSMFATLHNFRENKDKFKESKAIIESKDGSDKIYKPLAVYVTNDNFYYSKLHNMTLDDCIKTIRDNSKYYIDQPYNEESDILVLMTCSYENEGDRLLVFYISE